MLQNKDIETLRMLFSSHNYVMTTAELTASKLYYADIKQLLDEGLIERVRRGYYHCVRSILRDRAEKAGVKQIRVHDLRHSHASMLINLGANPVLVANRLGHESADITLKIYSHLFPSTQSEIVNKIKKV